MQAVSHANVISILDYFRGLEDPRSTVNRKHRLGDLIVISVCGVLAGADGPKAIGVWAESHDEWLAKYLELPNGIPSHDTIERLLAALTPDAFQSSFTQWSDSLQGKDRSSRSMPPVARSRSLRRLSTRMVTMF